MLVPSSQKNTAIENWELRTDFLLYHFSVHRLTEQLLKTIRKRGSIRAGDRVAVAVSGGADSVALLCLLLELQAELGIVLSVAHVNHKLRGEESDEDERFVATLAQQHGLELHACDAPVDDRHISEIDSEVSSKTGSEIGSGIEGAARKRRYGFFRQLAREGRVTKIATAHTLDDQAETVLLRIFRGSGIRGLSGIHPRMVFEEKGRAFGEVVRPLLNFRRATLQEFLRERGQSWREDSSNRNIAFLRNRVRHRLLPTIGEEFGEAAIEHMAELAEIARAEEEHWESGHPEIAAQCGPAGEPRETRPLPLGPLLALPLAAQRRLVRGWLETNAADLGISFRLIDETLELAHGAAGRKMELPVGRDSPRRNFRRGRQELLLEPERVSGLGEAGRRQSADYEYALTVPGAVQVPALGACIVAQVVDANSVPEEEREQLLDLQRVPKRFLVRNWRAGDRYWPAHTAAAKKVKELLSDRHATGAEKKLWPVAVAEGCGLVWMRGFAVPAAFRAPAGAPQAIWIREIAGMM
ncbi:MAG: tRNA lysidine(34) synthetase TilS [Terriglobales bacterium]|jgi:tRNA(Ile)-lysidine synthase